MSFFYCYSQYCFNIFTNQFISESIRIKDRSFCKTTVKSAEWWKIRLILLSQLGFPALSWDFICFSNKLVLTKSFADTVLWHTIINLNVCALCTSVSQLNTAKREAVHVFMRRAQTCKWTCLGTHIQPFPLKTTFLYSNTNLKIYEPR